MTDHQLKDLVWDDEFPGSWTATCAGCDYRCRSGTVAATRRMLADHIEVMTTTNSKDRKTARDAADRLGNVLNRDRLMALLSQDEIDWIEMVRERLYRIHRGRE